MSTTTTIISPSTKTTTMSSSNPSPTTLLTTDLLITKITSFVRDFMSTWDASHDFDHIQRVVSLALQIYDMESPSTPALDARTIILSALLHDVGDRKYVKPEDGDPSSLVHRKLLEHGADEELAAKVQAICLGVSYSSEIKEPAKVQNLIKQYPELAVVQDADRLDAIGAVGIGRVFTYGGAKTKRSMYACMDHMDEKLFKLKDMMKTSYGRDLAIKRTQHMEDFKGWWQEETRAAGGLLSEN